MKNDQLFWMCKQCTDLMHDVRMKGAVRAAYESGHEKLLTAHNEIVENLKQEILVELKHEIKSNFSSLINSSSMTPRTSLRTTSGIASTRRRRLFGKPSTSKAQSKPLMLGTSESLSPSLGNLAATAPRQKFWLYLSRISCDVTVEQVRALVSRRLGTDDVNVVRLVGKGRDVSTLSFISFKIGLNTDVKAKALLPSTWPKGIQYREFIDHRANVNFWKPQLTPTHDELPVNHSPHSAASITEEAEMME